MQQIEASLAATHRVLELLDRKAANRDHVNQIAQSVESHMARTDDLEAALVGLRGASNYIRAGPPVMNRWPNSPNGSRLRPLAWTVSKKPLPKLPTTPMPVSTSVWRHLHKLVAEHVQKLENTIHQQAESIESMRSAMHQTDDVVERLVEALESLQLTVIEHSETRTGAFLTRRRKLA